jgi:hypothetical protein
MRKARLNCCLIIQKIHINAQRLALRTEQPLRDPLLDDTVTPTHGIPTDLGGFGKSTAVHYTV